MSAETILAAMLASSSLDAIFGSGENRRGAMGRLPDGTDQTKPCFVFSVYYDEPAPNVNHLDGKKRARARVRVSVTAATMQEVISGHAAVRAALDFKINVVFGGHTVLRIRKITAFEMKRDDSLGVWWRPDDYDLVYFE